jgi:hypothetical protein
MLLSFFKNSQSCFISPAVIFDFTLGSVAKISTRCAAARRKKAIDLTLRKMVLTDENDSDEILTQGK